jgi:hypothetical protein
MLTLGEAIALGVVALAIVGPRNAPAVLRGAGRTIGMARQRFGDDGLRGLALIAIAMVLIVVMLTSRGL